MLFTNKLDESFEFETRKKKTNNSGISIKKYSKWFEPRSISNILSVTDVWQPEQKSSRVKYRLCIATAPWKQLASDINRIDKQKTELIRQTSKD